MRGRRGRPLCQRIAARARNAFGPTKEEVPRFPGLNGAFALGRLEVIRWGGEVALLAMGDMASHAASAAAMLASQGVATTVAVIACLAPAPVDDLCALLSSARVAIVVESHSIVGGLGSLVAEIAAEHALQCRVVRCGITRIPDVVGTPQYLHEQLGSSAAAIAACVVDVRRGIA